VALDLFLQNLKRTSPVGGFRALWECQGRWVGFRTQTYLVIVVWRVVLGTAPTTVSIF
jgi:hypothetical protein